MRILIRIALILAMSPAMGQSFYKCPSPTPGAPPIIQQMPCSATGGGEAMTVKPAKASGDGLRDSERAYLDDLKNSKKEDKPAAAGRIGEVQKECFDMQRRINQLRERESRGIHTWSKHGYEESHWRQKEYDELCGG